MPTPISETINCPYCGTEHAREASCLGRLGGVVHHRCPYCHGDFSYDIDPQVTEENEYWEKNDEH